VHAGIPMRMLSIQVIYENSNEGTHFKPFLDSVRIVGTILSNFLRFSVSSIFSAAIDIGIAWILLDYFRTFFKSEYAVILAATFIARIISTVVNYLMNRNFVFREKTAGRRSFVRYLMLCAVIIMFSATGVYILRRGFGLNEKIGKVVVDSLLYLLSYQAQQRWVFAIRQPKINRV